MWLYIYMHIYSGQLCKCAPSCAQARWVRVLSRAQACEHPPRHGAGPLLQLRGASLCLPPQSGLGCKPPGRTTCQGKLGESTGRTG